ncbi:hypothetical protein [Iningainema tapete]|uniref:Uncharacterized protein n=1 Tax=Iningainema tapete BLCC-T55 TaxID=2748662 RepID=A0A8J7C495_9CYAN|nr:hypothetical protein [Iningainema tapete]MBD2771164.1 hypothetical protein [Iningainema tapete BLCC-T55]
MLKLPFKTSPKEFDKVAVGHESIGELELPKYGDLSPNERIFIKENSDNIPDIRNSAVKMARTIATKSGKKMLDVYNALTMGDSEFLGDYLEEFVSFQELLEENSRQRNLLMATAIIKFRLCGDWGLENTFDATQIHPQLVDALATFARNEEAGWKDAEPTTEDDLGNSTIPQENQTGERSTGELGATSPTSKGFAPVASDISQPG